MRVGANGRGLAVALAALLVTGGAACGGGKGSGSGSGNSGGDGSGGTTGGGSGSGGNGSGTTGGGGSGTSGGSGSGTTGGSGSGTAGGSGGGGTGAGGAGSGTGGSGGAEGGGGTGSGGGTGGSGSGGGSGGTGSGGSTACDGLVPSAGAPVTRRFDTGTHSSCVLGTSSANGQVALGFGTGSAIRMDLYPPDGSAQQGSLAFLSPPPNADLDAWLHPTSAGWAGMVHEADPPPVKLRSFDGTGQTIATSPDLAYSSAPDPHGGTVLLGQSYASTAATPGPYGPLKLEWIDGSGAVIRTAPLDGYATMLLVDWGTGNVLTLGDGAVGPGASGLRARWWDGAGAPLTAWFDTGIRGVQVASLHLLLDGSIALSDGQTWRGVFRDGVAAMDPPPAWLAARPATRLATIRSGRGYAVIAASGGGDAPTSFEIVAASGESCGTVTLPAAPQETGIVRHPTSLQVGQDGTVIQSEELGSDTGALGSGNHCEFRWWPALLR